jgi:hypothetical protein
MGEIAYPHALQVKAYAFAKLANPRARGLRLFGVESPAHGAHVLDPDVMSLQETREFGAGPYAEELLQFGLREPLMLVFLGQKRFPRPPRQIAAPALRRPAISSGISTVRFMDTLPQG